MHRTNIPVYLYTHTHIFAHTVYIYICINCINMYDNYIYTCIYVHVQDVHNPCNNNSDKQFVRFQVRGDEDRPHTAPAKGARCQGLRFTNNGGPPKPRIDGGYKLQLLNKQGEINSYSQSCLINGRNRWWFGNELPKSNLTPEKWWFGKYFPSGRCYVGFRVGITPINGRIQMGFHWVRKTYLQEVFITPFTTGIRARLVGLLTLGLIKTDIYKSTFKRNICKNNDE